MKIVEVLLLREEKGKQGNPSSINLFSSQPIKSYAFCFPTVLTKKQTKNLQQKNKEERRK